MLSCPTCGKQYPADLHLCPADHTVLQADATIAGDSSVDPLLGQTLDNKYRIIHRDLKPANIFIVQKSDVPVLVKVLDFGIAKLAVDTFDEEEVKTLTLIGAMIGTPRYMSPEQCDGLQLTPAADVYSLGVILYEMLTGVAPFTGSTPLSIALKHATEVPRSPREIVATIPESLERLVLQALEKQPEARPANGGVFRQELLAIAEGLGLEHAAVDTAPDLKVLRDVGMPTPSGRLVVDIARLRESRVQAASTDELTVIQDGVKKVEPGESESFFGRIKRIFK